MPEQMLDNALALDALLAEQRPRLVNLCAALSGSRAAAEDLAQETLVEAWRSRSRLDQPQGAARWLSVIARHVCLRWLRAEGRQTPHLLETDPADVPDGAPDLELELERDELAGLLDRALALLPPATRQALIHKYVLELPQAESAARLGLSEGAVEARLARGKLSLHRLLQTDLRAEANAFGLCRAPAEGWTLTRLWCPICGRHKLHGQLPGAGRDFQLHCPRCSWAPDSFFAQSNQLPEMTGVTGFRAVLRRFMTGMYRHLAPGLQGEPVACRRCGRPARLAAALPPDVHTYPGYSGRGVSLVCAACGSRMVSDIYGLALDTPAGLEFWRAHPRLRTWLEAPLSYEGRLAWRVRFESVGDSAYLDVLLAQDSYAVLGTRLAHDG